MTVVAAVLMAEGWEEKAAYVGVSRGRRKRSSRVKDWRFGDKWVGVDGIIALRSTGDESNHVIRI